jgi:putative membrane protein
MIPLLVRWGIVTAAVAVAAWLVPGIYVEEHNQGWAVVVLALVLGLVNAFIRPLISTLSCGLIVLTLGLFTLVINALMLWLASWVTESLGFGVHVDGFWNALLGALIITIVSAVASTFTGKK